MAVDSIYQQLSNAMAAVKTARANLEQATDTYNTTVSKAGDALGAVQNAHANALTTAADLRTQLERELTSELGATDRVRTQ